uniref:Glutathione peroxidase n=1 Tax=Trichuris muris TaxID=70415 RepID=A0A5S6QWP8_TRIMR
MVSADKCKGSPRNLMETLRRIGKSPSTEQIVFGGASGWAAGFVCVKFGRYAAVAIGTTVLVLQIAVHRHYVRINWRSFEGTSQAAQEHVERILHGEGSSAIMAAKNFIKNNAFFAVAFSAGFLIDNNITIVIFTTCTVSSSMSTSKEASSVYDFTAKDIDSNEVSMERYKGHVLVVVNVATECGYTKDNYEQLQQLYDRYKDKGLRIAAFPCNQFGHQEPKSEPEIKKFATETHKVTFDLYSKVNVNGNDAHPLWSYLKEKQGGTLGSFIKWNFTKFLIDRAGQPVKRFGPNESAMSMEKDIVQLLGISTSGEL